MKRRSIGRRVKRGVGDLRGEKGGECGGEDFVTSEVIRIRKREMSLV
jgi:hypothetical protein